MLRYHRHDPQRTDRKGSARAAPSGADEIEAQRLIRQQQLDRLRSRRERNRLGQFATPPALALDMLRHARAVAQTASIRFLDPAVGTGTFFSALLQAWPEVRVVTATGFEVDPRIAASCRQLWQAHRLQTRRADFTRAPPPGEPKGRYDLVICNPPYVRHHHLAPPNKQRLRSRALAAAGVEPSALSGLYLYFMLLAHAWMAPNALAGWLVPAEFMDVNYGQALRCYLTRRVTLLRIHRFDPADLQFDEALVTSALVWFRNAPLPRRHRVEITQGGSLGAPHARRLLPAARLQEAPKWKGTALRVRAIRPPVGSTLGDWFRIQRGLATGANRFFILTPAQAAAHDIPARCLRPILPRPKHLPQPEVCTQTLLLLDCRLTEAEVREHHPGLWRYLQSGRPQVSEGYLCSRRTPWYRQEQRAPTPFLCSYIARPGGNGQVRRFILNHTAAIATNNYLMLHPRPALERFLQGDEQRIRSVWQCLTEIEPQALSAAGRVYGGGLYKLEPKELASLLVPRLAQLLQSVPAGPRG
jgi:hypothetical protein